MATAAPVLLYDSECRFCRFCAAVIAASDRRRRLGILPFTDPEAAALLERVPEDDRRTSMHLAWPDGRMSSAGDALVDLVMVLARPSASPGLCRRRALARWSGRAYRRVADARGVIGRLVPDVGPTRRPPS